MRAVIDTNVLIAALLSRGPAQALLEQVRAGTSFAGEQEAEGPRARRVDRADRRR